MGRNRIYGIGEPVTMRSLGGRLDAMKALDLIDDVGFTAAREWMHLPVILADPTHPKPEVVAAFTRTLDRYAELDIEVTGMSHSWFLPPECAGADSMSMPARDTTPGSLYMRTLEMLETSWYTLVKCFPQVPQWEVGNEWNIHYFLHPLGWKFPEPGLSLDEAMAIAVDMMFYSARGIRSANSQAKVASFSPTLEVNTGQLPYFIPRDYGIASALDRVYEKIKSGAFPSTNSDDYFDLLAWHPYLMSEMGMTAQPDFPPKGVYFLRERPDALWKAYSDAAYQVMVKYGDGHKQVLLTEFGFSDVGNPELEKYHAELFRQTFETLKEMPYIRTVHCFRLFEDLQNKGFPGTPEGTVSPECYFGIFREAEHNYEPRAKAYMLQQICGGTKDLRG